MARNRSTFDFLVDELMDRVLDIVEPAMEDALREATNEIVDRAVEQFGNQHPPHKRPRKNKHFRKNPSYDWMNKQWPKTTKDPSKTLYEILEVSPRASQETIDAAWKSLCKRYHPDVSGGNAERMKEINHAHETLSNPVERKRYDRTVL